MVLYASAASRFGCVAILDLYFSEYLLISSLTVGIPRSLRMPSFLTYQGAFTIVRLACIISILFIWLLAFYCLLFLIYFLCLIWIFGLLANAFVSLFSVFFLL